MPSGFPYGGAMDKLAASGTWLYDSSVPRRIQIWARRAEEAASRYVEDLSGAATSSEGFVIDDKSPIPATQDGYVYYVGATAGGEFPSVEAAKAWADAQPWGPVVWEDAE